MTDRPILFAAPMVSAILAGTKTQTRRVVKPQPPVGTEEVSSYHHPADEDGRGPRFWSWSNDPERPHGFFIDGKWCQPCPYGKTGDRLWVRETWAANAGTAGGHLYRADHGGASSYYQFDLKTGAATHNVEVWKPSIHMPRAVSRITLEITNVRVERLQACSKPDAIAEGIERRATGWRLYDDRNGYSTDPRYSFRTLWEQINGTESYDADPWVWVVEFARAAA